MCITELWWIGASTRQSADIKPNSKALPLSQLSHEAEDTLFWQNNCTARAGGWLVTLGSLADTWPQAPQPGWHICTARVTPSPVPSLVSAAGHWLPFAPGMILPSWYISLWPWKGGWQWWSAVEREAPHHICRYFWVATREKFVQGQPLPQGAWEFLAVGNQEHLSHLKRQIQCYGKAGGGMWRQTCAVIWRVWACVTQRGWTSSTAA